MHRCHIPARNKLGFPLTAARVESCRPAYEQDTPRTGCTTITARDQPPPSVCHDEMATPSRQDEKGPASNGPSLLPRLTLRIATAALQRPSDRARCRFFRTATWLQRHVAIREGRTRRSGDKPSHADFFARLLPFQGHGARGGRCRRPSSRARRWVCHRCNTPRPRARGIM
jgi:hypothetical protein